MANTEMLRKRISDAGTTITAVSKAIGMSRENFYNRLRSGEFTVSEMIQISDFLRLYNGTHGKHVTDRVRLLPHICPMKFKKAKKKTPKMPYLRHFGAILTISV